MAGATGPAPTEDNVAAAMAGMPADLTELEIKASHRLAERRAERLYGPAKKPNDGVPVSPFSRDMVETGIVAAGTAKPAQVDAIKCERLPREGGAAGTVIGPTRPGVKGSGSGGGCRGGGTVGATGPTGNIGPVGDIGPTAAQPAQNASQVKHGGTSPSLDFLDDFFGADKRHVVAIKKHEGKTPDIKARHFDADDRAGQQKFITDHGAAGFDLYFSPNPIKGTLHKKAKKNDVVEARHLWIDLDPR